MARILVVDDDADIREILRDHLEGAGHAVFEAGNGKDALAELQRTTCDLVITDVYMPGGDGLELISELNAVAGRLPIIAISGGGAHDVGLHMLSVSSVLGARAVLGKPFRGEELIRLVDEVLGAADKGATDKESR